MQRFQNFLNQKTDELAATASQATDYANAHPTDQVAQQVANLCSDAALAGRLLADQARYDN